MASPGGEDKTTKVSNQMTGLTGATGATSATGLIDMTYVVDLTGVTGVTGVAGATSLTSLIDMTYVTSATSLTSLTGVADIKETSKDTPSSWLIALIEEQKKKEDEKDIWKNSEYKDIAKLQSNNVGIVGEQLVYTLCNKTGIEASIDGVKTKQKGGGAGDGIINGKTVEIKTAIQGNTSKTFQHELGETPWKADYMIFLDISPEHYYMTIFENFTEEHYKSGNKCVACFPTKSITWRKKQGAFKLDTTVAINQDNIKKGISIKITDDIDKQDINAFVMSIIK
jgi:hypothetical protein